MIVALACAVSVQAQRTDTLKSQELQEVIVAGVEHERMLHLLWLILKRQSCRTSL